MKPASKLTGLRKALNYAASEPVRDLRQTIVNAYRAGWEAREQHSNTKRKGKTK